MAVTLKCADLGGDCPGEFTTATAEELMEHIALHASRAHPELQLTPEVVKLAQSLMHTT